MRTILFILLWIPAISWSQHKYDYTWMFGPYTAELGTMLLFEDGLPSIEKVTFRFNISEGSTLISDKFGSLKYYSNGCSIADSKHEIVAGADTLNPGWWYDSWCNGWNGYPYGDQAMVFLPFENNNYKLIYKYRNRKILGPNVVADINDTIYTASITDGELDYINKPIFNDTLSFGSLAAVKHANNTDYWIVTPHDSSNIYFNIHISKDSIIGFVKQQIDEIIRRNHRGVITRFSPDGNWYVGFEQNYKEQSIKIFSFNRSNGILTYHSTLEHPEDASSLVGGIEFSPSGQYLYVSTRNYIYQYDLEAADVESSKTVVAEYDGFMDPYACTFHVMQRGPDCRIYVNTSNSQQWLHVIMYPDRQGIDCEVRQHEIPLFYYHQISMPYFPNYRLGTGEPVCDSTLALPTSIPIVTIPDGSIRVWPNPARGQTWVGLSEGVARQATTMTLTSLLGQMVWQQPLTGIEGEAVPIPLEGLSAGIYFLQVKGYRGKRWVEKVVVE